jgi:hypothetical protein
LITQDADCSQPRLGVRLFELPAHAWHSGWNSTGRWRSTAAITIVIAFGGQLE